MEVSLDRLEQSKSNAFPPHQQVDDELFDSSPKCDSSAAGSPHAVGGGNEENMQGHVQAGASNLQQRVKEIHCTLADTLRLQRRFTERFSGLIAQQNKRLDSVADSVQQVA